MEKRFTFKPARRCVQCSDAVGWAVGRYSDCKMLSGGVLAWLSAWSEVQTCTDATATHWLLLQYNVDWFLARRRDVIYTSRAMLATARLSCSFLVPAPGTLYISRTKGRWVLLLLLFILLVFQRCLFQETGTRKVAIIMTLMMQEIMGMTMTSAASYHANHLHFVPHR